MSGNDSDNSFVDRSYTGAAAQFVSYRDAGSPPANMDVVPIVCGEGCISTPEQLQGILGHHETPKCEPADAETPLQVCWLRYRDYRTLMERAVLGDGPIVSKAQRFGKPITLASQMVLDLKLSAHAPGFLTHEQTCPDNICPDKIEHAYSSKVFQRPDRGDSLAESTRDLSLATTAVLNTPELLEAILVQADMRTLLVSAMRVSKLWHSTIQLSTSSQSALFFQAQPHTSSKQISEPNPLLAEVFGPAFFDVDTESEFIWGAHSLWKLPFCPEHLTKMYLEKNSIFSLEPPCRIRAFTRSGASWRRMFVSQPPPPFLGFAWRDDDPRRPQRRTRCRLIRPTKEPYEHESAPKPPGLRMGQLYDVVQHFTTKGRYGSMYFQVHWDKLCLGTEEPQGRRSNNKNNRNEYGKRPNREGSHVLVYFREKASATGCPFRLDVTRDTFRCEDAVEPDVYELSSIISGPRGGIEIRLKPDGWKERGGAEDN